MGHTSVLCWTICPDGGKTHLPLKFQFYEILQILAELGLIKFIGDKTVELISVSFLIPSVVTLLASLQSVDREHQLLVAILLIVWVSAIASSFIDNIPFTTAMVT